MTAHKFIESWVFLATWSIREAAYLVNELDPLCSGIEISAKFANPVSKTYYWLKKEYLTGNLTKVAGTDDEPRFSPGTLMRRLSEKGHSVPSRIQTAYDNRGQTTGPHKINLEATPIYRMAASLIWDQYPTVTLWQMADVLSGLRSYMTSSALPSRMPVTIRKYLKGLSPNKPGRPKGGTDPVEVDLAEIGKNMDLEMGPD